MVMEHGLTSIQSAQGQEVLTSVPVWQTPCGHQLTLALFQANQKPEQLVRISGTWHGADLQMKYFGADLQMKYFPPSWVLFVPCLFRGFSCLRKGHDQDNLSLKGKKVGLESECIQVMYRSTVILNKLIKEKGH